MKSRLLLFVICAMYSFSTIAQTQYTSIPDTNFELALSDYDDIPGDNQVPTANINSLTLLDVGGKNISDLTGIHAFTSLTILGFYDNQLTSVDLSNNTSLIYLYAYNNQLTSLDVSNNSSLTYLYCNNNQLESLDVSYNSQLEVLHCNFNQLASIDVTNNSNLSVLRCGHNLLTNVDVSQNFALTELLADESNLQSLDLSANTSLARLYCNSCNLSSLNVKNGNNYNIEDTWFRIENNPDLFCVEVDDAEFSSASWFFIDEQTMFDENCDGTLSPYVIIAKERVRLKNNNHVLSGSVGVTDSDGKAMVKKYSNVIETVEAAQIILDNTSSIGTEVLAPADVDVSEFIYNTVSNGSSPNIVVQQNQTLTLNDSEYGKVIVKDGGTVIFSNSNVYLKELKVKKSATVDFEQCTNVFILKDLKFNRNSNFNSSNNSVIVYVDGKVEVKRGVDIVANINANDHVIKAEAKFYNPTSMKGLFIGRKVKGEKFVYWEMDENFTTCSSVDTSVARNSNNQVKDKQESTIHIEKSIKIIDQFAVNTWPIPSSSSFNVKVNTPNNLDTVLIHVYDMNGRLVHKDAFNSESQYSFGGNLQSGIYVVKITQASDIDTIRVIKN